MDFEKNLKEYLSDTFIKDLMDSLEKERTNSLILNTKKISLEKFISEFPKVEKHPFLENVVYFDKSEYQFGKSYMFDNGTYYIMDASSLLVSHFLPIKDEDVILDMCAAPGGKTISLALKNSDKNIEIISNDISYKRSLELSSNIERLGLANVVVTNSDLLNIYENYLETFNAIILDAPCSGSAMFRKNEKAYLDWTIEKVLSLQKTQIELLEIATQMLKVGGYISYSTCSFSYEENEAVILEILKNHPEMEAINIAENMCFYKDKNLPEAIHAFPNLYRGEGQFICLLRKKDCTCSLQKSGVKLQNNFKNPRKTPIFSKKLKNSVNNSNFLKNKLFTEITSKYDLDFNKYINLNDEIFATRSCVNLSYFNVIRFGLHLGKISNDLFVPDFHLAHYLDNKYAIILDDEQAKKYLHGEELIDKNSLKNGYYVVSYNGINLGFVKCSNGKLKNLYPKGLRH